MTTFREFSVICDCCKTESKHPEITSCSSCGSVLDMREHHLGFDPIYLFIYQCPKCGYSSYELDKYNNSSIKPEDRKESKKRLEIIKKYINEELYRSQLKDNSMHQCANKYYCSSLIYEHLGEILLAASTAHRGAWICDDFGDTKNADILRVRAAKLYLEYLNENKDIDEEKKILYGLIITDLSRRAGDFGTAERTLEDMKNTNPPGTAADVLKIQKVLIEAKNKSIKSFEDYAKFNARWDKTESTDSEKDTLF